MSQYALLLSPRLLSLANRFKRREEGSVWRLVLIGVMAAAFWAGVFIAAGKVLTYFQAVEGFGHILARKLMDMVWLTFFAVLLFSNVVTSLSTFFLSRDLPVIHAAPISRETIFWARMTDTLIDSSWMVVFFGLPVFLAYGAVFDAGVSYYLKLAAAAAPFLVLATSLSVLFTMLLVNVFPAQRTKDLLFLLTIMVVIVLYLMFRFMRPERLVNPDAFASAVSYFASLSTPTSPYLPSFWVSEALWPSLEPGTYSQAGFFLLFLWSTAAAAAVVASWVTGLVYGYAYSKSREGARRVIPRMNPAELFIKVVSRPFAPSTRVIIAKDIRAFFRDNTQWSQLLLLLALIVIYLYNFKVLDLKRAPIQTFYLQNFISFLNIGLASFVGASLCVRFAFPAVSQEGFSYWIIRSSPLSLKRFLWTKFLVYAPPLVIVSEILIAASNYLLNVTPFMMAISTATIFFIALGLTGLAVGLGAVYPRFETENLAQVATGFGGMVFMITAALFVAVVVVLEAFPVYAIFMAQARGLVVPWWKWALIGLCFLAVLAVMAAAVFWPMQKGLKALIAREQR